MSICRWCYEEEATTIDGLCQGCAKSLYEKLTETEEFDLDKWLAEDDVKCNSDNCHHKLRDIKFTSEEVKHSLEEVGIELVDGELNMEKPEFFSKVLTAKDIKNFMKDIPDDAQVIFSDGFLTFMFDNNTLILNRYGAEWDNGVGYINGKCCGECTHFDCLKCGKEIK